MLPEHSDEDRLDAALERIARVFADDPAWMRLDPLVADKLDRLIETVRDALEM